MLLFPQDCDMVSLDSAYERLVPAAVEFTFHSMGSAIIPHFEYVVIVTFQSHIAVLSVYYCPSYTQSKKLSRCWLLAFGLRLLLCFTAELAFVAE